jgi:hypothetical protein
MNIHSTPEQLVEDLFNRGEPIYPAAPGSAKSETSKEAANLIFDFARGIRGQIARRMYEIYPKSEIPDETAVALGISVLTARPRFTELSSAGLIEKSGEQRSTLGLVVGGRHKNRFKSEAYRATRLLLDTAPSIVPERGENLA